MNKCGLIGLIAPGSSVEPGAVDLCVKAIEKMGFNAVVGDACTEVGNPRQEVRRDDLARARDLEKMFADVCVSGIMALRGGYGCGRILDLTDYDLIRRNPKPLFGYSDITALHIALGQKAGLKTYHTPMPASEFSRGLDRFSTEYLMRCLCEREPFGIVQNPYNSPLKTVNGGKCRGVLTGGNLSVIVSLLGTPYEIDTRNKILFLEDVSEPLYKIDRMLLQLRLAGKFHDCAGVLFGSFTENGEEITDPVLGEIFEEHINCVTHRIHKKKPALSGLACGHCLPTVSLPLGATAFVDADKKIIRVM